MDLLPSNDEVLAEAIKHSKVVVGQAGTNSPEPKTAAEAALQTGFAVRGPDARQYVVTFAGLLRNVGHALKAAEMGPGGVGHRAISWLIFLAGGITQLIAGRILTRHYSPQLVAWELSGAFLTTAGLVSVLCGRIVARAVVKR